MEINNDALYAHIADHLKSCRFKRNLTQDALARQAGVARTTIANIETGKQHAPIHLIYALCSVLDTEPLKLLPTLRDVAATKSLEYEIDGKTHPVTPKVLQFIATIEDSEGGG